MRLGSGWHIDTILDQSDRVIVPIEGISCIILLGCKSINGSPSGGKCINVWFCCRPDVGGVITVLWSTSKETSCNSDLG